MQSDERSNDARRVGKIIIFCSIIASFIISVTVDMTYFELGALFNYFVPPFIGLVTLGAFAIICWTIKNPNVRIIAFIFLSAYNLYTGFELRHTRTPFPF